MIKIKRSDIEALLVNYRDRINKQPLSSSSFRKATESLPKILADLDDFITKLNSSPKDSHELTPEQTFQLTTILLGRKIRSGLNNREKLSEDLVNAFEENFFNPDELKELKKHLDSNTLNFKRFMAIYNFNSETPRENTVSSLDSMSKTESPELTQIPLNELSHDEIDSQPRIFQNDEMNIILLAESSAYKLALSQTSRYYYRLFSNENAEKFLLLRKLLSHGALGELEQAEDIWRKHPDLLTHYGTVYHPNRIYEPNNDPYDVSFHHNPGRYKHLNLTYLQTLWANEEYEEAKKIEDILEPAEVKKQFFEVFPDGVIKKDNFNLEHATTLLNEVFEAIVEDETINASNFDEMNAVTRAALYALHKYAKPEFEHKTGLVFDPHFYLAALALYDNKAHGGFKEKHFKYDFWCIRVEEWLAGCLPTGYLRPHAQGIGNNVIHRRGCLLGNKSSYFAFRRGRHSTPGLHCFISYLGTPFMRGAPWDSRGTMAAAQRISSIISSKSILANDLAERATQAVKQTQDLCSKQASRICL